MPGGETSSSFVFHLGRPAGGDSVAVCSWPRRSLAGLVDVRVEVLGGGQLGDTRLGLLVSHLGSCRGEVLIALERTHSQSIVFKDKISILTQHVQQHSMPRKEQF